MTISPTRTSSADGYQKLQQNSKAILSSLEALTRKNGRNEKANVADSFTLSPTANMMQQFLNMDLGQTGEHGETGLSGLEQLKSHAGMLANMLQMKLKGFESSMISSMQQSGLNPYDSVTMKNGGDGFLLSSETITPDRLQQFLKSNPKLQEQFQELTQAGNLLQMMQKLESLQSNVGQSAFASQYAQQSQLGKASPKNAAELQFVVRMLQGSAAYSFE